MSVSLVKEISLYSIKWIEAGVAFPHEQTIIAVSEADALATFWTEGMCRVVQSIDSITRLS